MGDRPGLTVALVLLLAAAYGAGVQYLGSVVHTWGPDVASLSAPWLLLAFLAGATQRDPVRGALFGLCATFAALVGYFLLTDSPLEGAHYSLANTHGFFLSNAPVVLGGIVTGPLFGWFGQQWRTRRAIAGALVAAAAFCLEPLARRAAVRPIHMLGHGYAVTNPIDSHVVVFAEVVAGIALAAAVLARRYAAGERAGA
ncbi:MAG TPA: DUF6518 family protein [Gaiellaceae bacterium]|nr:DUF6518 family protein [Gaiellaceae bacterium]